MAVAAASNARPLGLLLLLKQQLAIGCSSRGIHTQLYFATTTHIGALLAVVGRGERLR